jgi:7-carboxy-7-deazaguanine synthase
MGRMYKVVETFTSIQGEGHLTGKKMFFIRLFGCNLDCHFCDEPLHKEKGNITEMTTSDLLRLALEENVEWVCITGGEPSINDLSILIAVLQNANMKVQVETNGFRWENIMDANWITLSPKEEVIPLGKWNEVKLVVNEQTSLDWIETVHKSFIPHKWLQPMNYMDRVSETNLKYCWTLLQRFRTFGLSVQLHKILEVN